MAEARGMGFPNPESEDRGTEAPQDEEERNIGGLLAWGTVTMLLVGSIIWAASRRQRTWS